MKTFDRLFSAIFLVLAVAALCGAVANNAWWHVGTAVLSLTMALALKSDQQEKTYEP